MISNFTFKRHLALLAACLWLVAATPAAQAAQPPSIDNESASAVTQTGAMLDTTINPDGQAVAYRFEYIDEAGFQASGYENATRIPIPDGQLEAIHGEIVEGQQLSGLTPNTTYHYRVQTTPASVEEGEDRTFTTLPPLPPLVATLPAVNTSQQAVTLAGTIDSRGLPTVYEFDLGPDTSYGTRIFGEASQAAGAETYAVTIQALEPGTTYHYRLQATNAYSTSYGTDQAFTTATYPTIALAAPVSPPLLPAPLIAPAPTHAASGHTAGAAARTARHRSHVKQAPTRKHPARKRPGRKKG